MAYSWITFDCYGTLIDWESGMREAFAPLLASRGIDNGAPLAARYIECEMFVERGPWRPYRDILCDASAMLFKQQFGATLSDEERAALVLSMPRWKPFPEVREALTRLSKRYKLAILSNVDDALLEPALKALGVRFDDTITAEQVRSYKPVNTHWKEALERFRITEDALFHVGASSLHDVMPAKQLGIACAWINRHNEKAFASAAPDVMLPDLSGLPEYLGA